MRLRGDYMVELKEYKIKKRLECALIESDFITIVYSQIRKLGFAVIGGSTRFKFDGIDTPIYPNIAILDEMKGDLEDHISSIPIMTCDIVTHATEEYVRNEKLEVYRDIGVSESWIIDWRNRTIEIYINEPDVNGIDTLYLYKRVSDNNKSDLKIATFPTVEIHFDDLFGYRREKTLVTSD